KRLGERTRRPTHGQGPGRRPRRRHPLDRDRVHRRNVTDRSGTPPRRTGLGTVACPGDRAGQRPDLPAPPRPGTRRPQPRRRTPGGRRTTPGRLRDRPTGDPAAPRPARSRHRTRTGRVPGRGYRTPRRRTRHALGTGTRGTTPGRRTGTGRGRRTKEQETPHRNPDRPHTLGKTPCAP